MQYDMQMILAHNLDHLFLQAGSLILAKSIALRFVLGLGLYLADQVQEIRVVATGSLLWNCRVRVRADSDVILSDPSSDVGNIFTKIYQQR